MQFWRELEGADLQGKVRLQRLLSTTPEALFAGQLLGSDNRAVLVRMLPEASLQGPVLERFLEATFFDHPNLLRCFGAGTETHRDTNYIYIIQEYSDATLNDLMRSGPVSPDVATEVGLHLIEGLQYLHDRNLVYCNLHPSTAVRAGNVWKLADFSQIRLAGAGYAAETRKLVTARPGTPPEAFEGYVSPAWDVWGLAYLLRAAVTGPRPSLRDISHDQARALAKQELPEPFATITSECLTNDPRERPGIDRIAGLLREPPASFTVPPVQIRAPDFPEALSMPVPPVREPPIPLAGARGSEVPILSRDREGADRQMRSPIPKAKSGWQKLAAIAGGVLVLILLFFWTSPGDSQQTSAGVNSSPTPTNVLPLKGSVAARSNPADTSATRNREADPETQVRETLMKWADAVRTRDASKQMSLYTPRVDRFYYSRNVSRDWIRRNREQALRQISSIRTLDLSNIVTTIDGPDRATVTFDRTWDYTGRPSQSGKAQSQLKFRNIDGEWKIVGERDLKTYWIKRGSGRS